jgi:hypothetical protein
MMPDLRCRYLTEYTMPAATQTKPLGPNETQGDPGRQLMSTDNLLPQVPVRTVACGLVPRFEP